MIARFVAALPGLLLATAAAAQGDPPRDPSCPQGDLAFERGPGSVCIGRLTERYAFSVIYPAAAAAIPALDSIIRDEARAGEAALAADADSQPSADGENAPPPFSYEQGWWVDAERPDLVAASSTIQSYTGGAHGGIDYHVIILDRISRRRITLADLFSGPAGLAAAQRAFCDALTAEVRSRREDPAEVVNCPAVAEQPISLVGGEHGTIEMMRALLNPYVVGPWAEGPYEFDFEVTAEMLAALKPRYRPAFALRR